MNAECDVKETALLLCRRGQRSVSAGGTGVIPPPWWERREASQGDGITPVPSAVTIFLRDKSKVISTPQIKCAVRDVGEPQRRRDRSDPASLVKTRKWPPEY